MESAVIGYLLGGFLATAGVSYIWIGILMAAGVRKRWPRFTYWSAACLAWLLGHATYIGGGEIASLVSSAAAAAFVIYRARADLFSARPSNVEVQ